MKPINISSKITELVYIDLYCEDQITKDTRFKANNCIYSVKTPYKDKVSRILYNLLYLGKRKLND